MDDPVDFRSTGPMDAWTRVLAIADGTRKGCFDGGHSKVGRSRGLVAPRAAIG